MNQKRVRDSCSMASTLRDQLLRASHDRIYRSTNQFRDMNPALLRLAHSNALLRRACQLGYHGAANRLIGKVNRLTEHLRHDLNGLQALDHPGQSIPTLGQLTDELQQIQDEFGEWQYNRQSRLLSVRTGPIELEDVYLGPFSIELELSEFSHFAGTQSGTGQHPFRVVALDPHPATGNSHVTHPHISDERLCTGESTHLISSALSEGRLADFFLMVRSLLQTYNPDSPYVPLDAWTGTSCHECGERVHEDDRYYCDTCEHDVCDGCTGSCSHCSDSACLGCLINCKHCEEYQCGSCMKKCSECGEPSCIDCLDDGLCPPCVEDKENPIDPEDDYEEQLETTPQETPVEVVPVLTPAV